MERHSHFGQDPIAFLRRDSDIELLDLGIISAISMSPMSPGCRAAAVMPLT